MGFGGIYPVQCSSDFSGSVVLCLTLIWGKSSVTIVSNICSIPFSLPSIIPSCAQCTFCRHPLVVLGYSVV